MSASQSHSERCYDGRIHPHQGASANAWYTAAMQRGALTNDEWARLPPLLPPHKPTTGRPTHDHRRVIKGMLWVARTGAPWRDLPDRDGAVGTVASRFPRWRTAGMWDRIWATLQQQADAAGHRAWHLPYMDGSSVRAHQHAAGATSGPHIQQR